MSPHENDSAPSFQQLAATLCLAADRFAETARQLQEASGRQHEQLGRLTALRDRIAELLAACRHLAGGASAGTEPLPHSSLPGAALVELTSWAEFEKFRRMPPITAEDVAACDVDELLRQLGEDAP